MVAAHTDTDPEDTAAQDTAIDQATIRDAALTPVALVTTWQDKGTNHETPYVSADSSKHCPRTNRTNMPSVTDASYTRRLLPR